MSPWRIVPLLALLGAPSAASAQAPLDTPALERVLGRKGAVNAGEFKVTVPQNDLDVRVDGFRIVPPMGLGSWAAFTPHASGAMVMGDLVVRPDEIAPVQRILVRHGLSVSGLHNHFVRDEPDVMFMHIHGVGSQEAMARGVKAALDEVQRLRGRDPAQASAPSVASTIDFERLASILGHRGEASQGVYKVTIGRPDVALRDHGAPVSSFAGFNTWASFQGTPEKAAVSGDFAMLEHEVAPVIEALVERGIEVVAVHNHMVTEQPRIFFLHYWGTGPAEDLARALRAGLDRTGGR